MRRRALALLCTLTLLLTLLVPTQAVGEVCFTAINDTLLPLTADTMPVWSGGYLYVPYSVFAASTVDGKLEVNCIYSRNSNTVSVYVLRRMLVFDLNEGTCYEQNTGEQFPSHAILRNGTAYLPVARVCDYFGLNYSYLRTQYGYLLRIKNLNPVDKNNNKAQLTDDGFIDAGGQAMSDWLRKYNESLRPAQRDPVTPTQPETPSTSQEPEADPTAITTYLAFRCETAQAGQSIADALERSGATALFFFPAEEIGCQGALIRRLLGSGHSVGLLAEGSTLDQTQELLQAGRTALETVAHTRTYLALVPDSQQQQLQSEGWVCWNTGVDAVPDGSRTPYNQAVAAVRSLPKKGTARLTLDDSQSTADAMTYLIRQLKDQNYVVALPRETYL